MRHDPRLGRCTACGRPFYRGDDAWKTLCLPCWKKTKQARTHTAVESIPDEMLSRLIRLCHPDKHGNSTAANAATAWLISLRGK